MTGTEDFAYSYDNNRVAKMRTSPYFTEAKDGRSGNFAYRVKEGYSHGGVAAIEYTYNGLILFGAIEKQLQVPSFTVKQRSQMSFPMMHSATGAD